ncbi:MAG: DUF5060 domain-containing protein [Bacteroidales bacterium]|nr:DUF5060 domain-containing protein [Bacteroidales bacterium]
MKKPFTLIILLGITCGGFCQPQFDSLLFPNTVSLFDKFEISFKLSNSYSDPYDPNVIRAYAVFNSPNNETDTVEAFYYEEYTFKYVNGIEKVHDSLKHIGWRIRFTPNQVGTWRFNVLAKDANGTSSMPNNGTKKYNFTCNSVNNADGFISKANPRFLKRDVVKNERREFRSFFPIGPNVAWYNCNPYGDYSRPKGIYYYKRYIDSLSGNANYMRIFLNRYQYLSLYGPEYTQFDGHGDPIVYFDSTINQKDSAELDYIIEYAAQHGVAVMPCIFSYGDFSDDTLVHHSEGDSSTWHNNPFHTMLGLPEPCDFFDKTQDMAKEITKKLLRYIVSRWGYATNIMCWELWNEVSNMFKMCDDDTGDLQHDVLSWHNEMAHFIRKCDPHKHCITTSMGNVKKTLTSSHVNYNYELYRNLFDTLDIVQQHNYQNIQKAKSREQISKVLYDTITKSHDDFRSKPFFMGEFGFGGGANKYIEKDSYGIDLHNSLWSSLFSTAIGPGSFWWWSYLNHSHLFHNRYAPLLTFCQDLPILSGTFTAHQTGDEMGHMLVFPNYLETYYMINATEDTIYGWSQDTAIAYQSLRWLTDSVQTDPNITHYMHFVDSAVFDSTGYAYTLNPSKRPKPSFDSNVIEIPISNQPIGTTYKVIWYNTETGLRCFHNQIYYASVGLNGLGNKVLSINFPSEIRDLKNEVINNTFGDVVFALIKDENNPLNQKKQPTLE